MAGIETWTDSTGRRYRVVIYPEKKGKGDCKVFVVEDGCGREQGHITMHADGTINKHGIFKKLKPPVPSKFNKPIK
ncbi:MAG: hypothetical protein GY795_47725 [Desulfobacterales bacterium]|nr:hypothetical protein [Desulfobacterales bacterium]